VEVVATLSQGRTAAAQCGLFAHKSVPVIFEPPCNNFCKVEIWSTNYMSNNFLFTLPVYGLMTVTLEQPKHVAAIYNCYTEVVC